MHINYFRIKLVNNPYSPSKRRILLTDIFEKQSKNINFTGFSNKIGENLYKDPKEIQSLVNIYYESDGTAGNFPREWIEKIPKEEREAKLKELLETFNDIFDLNKQSCLEDVSQELDLALHKAGILSENQKVKIKEIGEGTFGTAYLIEENFQKGERYDKYVIKQFKTLDNSHKKSIAGNDMIDSLKDHHGNYIENNRGTFFTKNAGEKEIRPVNRSRYYLGNVKRGYIISRFIDENIAIPDKNKVAGKLPFEWREKFPQSKCSTVSDNIYKVFKEAVKELRLKGQTPNSMEEASEKIDKALHEAHILEDNEKVRLKKVNTDKLSTNYLLVINDPKGIKDDKYLIKVFNEVKDRTFTDYIWDEGKRFRFADFEADYILSDRNFRRVKKLNPAIFGLYGRDDYKYRNMIGNYQLENGGLEIVNPLLATDKVASWAYNQIYSTPAEERTVRWNELYDKKMANKWNVLQGLEAALDLLPREEQLECKAKLNQ